jgi:hypothetical protein
MWPSVLCRQLHVEKVLRSWNHPAWYFDTEDHFTCLWGEKVSYGEHSSSVCHPPPPPLEVTGLHEWGGIWTQRFRNSGYHKLRWTCKTTIFSEMYQTGCCSCKILNCVRDVSGSNHGRVISYAERLSPSLKRRTYGQELEDGCLLPYSNKYEV